MTLFNPTGKVETSGTSVGIADREQAGNGEVKTHQATPEELDAVTKQLEEKTKRELSPKEKTIVDIILGAPEPRRRRVHSGSADVR